MTDAERIKELEKELSFYKTTGAVGLYYELNRFVNSTVVLMRTTTIESLLKPAKEDDPKKFEKMMSLIKNAKENVIDMEDIKTKLGLTGDEEVDKKKKPFIDRISEQRI